MFSKGDIISFCYPERLSFLAEGPEYSGTVTDVTETHTEVWLDGMAGKFLLETEKMTQVEVVDHSEKWWVLR